MAEIEDLKAQLAIAREPKLEDILNVEELEIERARRKDLEKELVLRESAQNKAVDDLNAVKLKLSTLESESKEKIERKVSNTLIMLINPLQTTE